MRPYAGSRGEPRLLLALAALCLALTALARDDGARLISAGLAAGHRLAGAAAPAPPAPATMPAGLRAAASAAIGAATPSYGVRTANGLSATGGGVSSRFARSGVTVAAAGGSVTFRVAGLGGSAPPAARANRVTYAHAGVEEWYVNGPAGLEQGFTLAHRPAGGRPAIVQRLSTPLVPRQAGQSVVFSATKGGSPVLRYGGLRVVDAAGRELPAAMTLAGRTLVIRVDDRGARYPVTIDPQIQQGPELVPSDGASAGGGEFGFSVALSDDGNTALVGAPFENGTTGAAWVFVRSGGTWTQQGSALTPTNPLGAAGQLFGWSVALSGDGNTAMIGGYADNDGHGAVWVATRSAGAWTIGTKLTPPPPTAGANAEQGTASFGFSVALSADGQTAVIGGPGDNGDPTAVNLNVPDAGAAWVYANSGGWAVVKKLTPAVVGAAAPTSEEQGAGRFGAGVAISGCTGTCSGTILVGAPDDSGSSGNVWLFSGPAWTEQAYPTLARTGEIGNPGEFGTSVALSNDGTVALVGSPSDDQPDAGGTEGSAWVFTFGTSWTQTALLTGSGESSFARFGGSVALSRDGSSALVGGEGNVNPGTFSTGAAWVFRNGASWAETCTEEPSEAGSGFGAGVALSSDGGTEMIGGPFLGEGGAWPFVRGACVSNESATVRDDQSAEIFGHVDPSGTDVNYRVDYGTTTAYGQSTPSAPLSSGSAPVDVDQVITGLQPATTYHYRVAATGANGTAGADRTFTTGPQLTGAAGTQVTGTLATDSGCPASATIDWGDGTPADQVTIGPGLPSHCFNPPLQDAIDFLVVGTHTYTASGHYSITVTTDVPKTYGAGALIAAKPTVTNTASSNVNTTDAGVSATIDPQGSPTTYVVNYGTSANYGQSTAPASVGTGFGGVAVAQTLTGLSPGTLYHFQFASTNATGTTLGPDMTFTTASSGGGVAPAPTPTAPTIVGEAAPSIAATTATVSASINPNGSATTFVVDYGTTPSYGQQTAPVAIGAGTALQIVNQVLNGLTASTTYHFRFEATNAAGTTLGPDVAFTTAVPGGSAQQPPPGPVQNVALDVLPFTGDVLVNGQPLQVGQQIPLGSVIDARNGTIVLQGVINGVLQSMQFAGGIFQVFQLPDGTIQLVLQGGDFSSCKTTTNAKKKKTKRKPARHTSMALNAKTVRGLWGNGKGSFQTKGKYASATVRGTIYHVADRCDGTFTHVVQGVVAVQDFALNRTFSITAGKSYLAKPKK